MSRLTACAAIAAGLLCAAGAPSASAAVDDRGAAPLDLAIIGDTPYGASMIQAFPAHVDDINADPKVRLVMHLGDIKNGSSRCDTSYFQDIRTAFDRFADPLVYTPGDNEWTDCHRANNGGYQPAGTQIPGAPVVTAGPSRLDEVRRIFFDEPGRTLGRRARTVETQGAPIVENVRWTDARTEFGVLDVPGSNNDLQPWFGAAQTPALKTAQADEYATRNAANLRWIDRIFDRAQATGARTVVLGIQADMWDPAITGDPAGYSGFQDTVRALADHARHFPGQILLLNGDSHRYESDKPLADPTAANNTIYGIDFAVHNLTRITVDGSADANDWLRLHIDPRQSPGFRFERVPYTVAG